MIPYLHSLGFTDKESDIIVCLFQYGAQAASSIAKHTKIERTNTYKILLQLVEKGLVMTSRRRSVTVFFIPSADSLRDYIGHQQRRLAQLDANFDTVATEVAQRESQRSPHLPKITLFEGIDGIQHLFGDIYKQAKSQQLLSIKCFANNTLDAKSLSPLTLGAIVADQIALLQSEGIHIESYLANGVMIMEHISKSIGTDIVSDLPAGHRAINIRVVGTIVYIITYKTPPVGVKFVSEELANALHVMLGAIG